MPGGEIRPERKKPESDAGYFELLSKAVFQAGFSYKVVHNKWDGISKAFLDFDTKKISEWKDQEILDVLESPEIIRNMKKIRAIVDNAGTFEEIVKEHGSFEKYLQSYGSLSYEEKKNALTSHFKWLGKTGAFFFFYCINDPDIPSWEER